MPYSFPQTAVPPSADLLVGRVRFRADNLGLEVAGSSHDASRSRDASGVPDPGVTFDAPAAEHATGTLALELTSFVGREREIAELEILLVLDNCEHLVDACARVADALLRACLELSILATSCEALGIAGERSFPVPPLSQPGPARLLALGSLAGYEATRLFVERAKAVVPGFELTEGNAPEVARLCRALDGMPLALELAAARVRGLSVEQISSRLEGSFNLLT